MPITTRSGGGRKKGDEKEKEKKEREPSTKRTLMERTERCPQKVGGGRKKGDEKEKEKKEREPSTKRTLMERERTERCPQKVGGGRKKGDEKEKEKKEREPSTKRTLMERTERCPQKVTVKQTQNLPNLDDIKFPDRLKLNGKKFGVPMTSTPRSVMESVEVTQKDVDTCFGFDVSDEENYDTLISPIPRKKKLTVPANPIKEVFVKGNEGGSAFNALLARYAEKDPDDDDEDPELHLDPSKITKTYSRRSATYLN